MRLPKRNKRADREIIIPELFGGMNLRDSVSMIEDNQLTDCLNMWKADGMLKTRPGINCREFADGEYQERYIGKYKKHQIFINYSGEELQLVTLPVMYNSTNRITYIHFFLLGKNLNIKMPDCGAFGEADGYFVTEKDGYLYCFLDDGNFSICKYKLELTGLSDGSWETITDDDRYTPIVFAHCKPLGKKNAEPAEIQGTMTEGYNLISDYYKIIYNSFNSDLITDTNKSHMMCYHLPENISQQKYIGKTITVKYTSKAGIVTHTIPINSRDSLNEETSRVNSEGDPTDDGVIVGAFGNRIWFYTVTADGKRGEVKYISDDDAGDTANPDVRLDDIEITAPYIREAEDKNKIFKMNECEWFGGGTAGLAGGTRLFLCGNNENKNLVVWSGLNNPLYFPENSYFNVGSAASAVTAFGKQGDKLIIFKETETWFTQYYQNTEISAKDLINQAVVDYTSSSVYFPLSQINPFIGCPYPDTVQLCRNRLVWLDGNKRVCALVSESNYNERNIYTVSEMVQRKIDTESAEYVSSADWNGYYCLFFGNKIYLMDYNCYGFTYIASYSKTEDANLKIPWYYWELPGGEWKASLCAQGYLGGIRDDEINFYIGFFDKALKKDCLEGKEVSITSSLTSKLFEFSAPHIRKSIERVDLQLGANGGESIRAGIITDAGIEEAQITLHSGSNEPYSADFVENRAIFPAMRNVLRFGIRLKSTAPLSVDGAVIKYRYTGGIR